MVKVLLIIECQPRVNWYRIFADSKLHGKEDIQVEQTTWQDLTVISYPDRCQVELRRPALVHTGTSQERNRVIQPDFILMRSVTRSVGHLDDRNKLYALKHAGIPSVNSLESCYLALERAWMMGELKDLQRRLGKENFPLISQSYYAQYKGMVFPPECPCVVKIGPYHSGFGKILIKDTSQFDDIRGIVAMHDDYATAEPFIDWDYDIRIQKIGPWYRAFARQSPNWKGNVGHVATNEDIPVTPQYKFWVDECAKLMGGLDICALDLVHSRADGKEYIFELNDTAIGLANRWEEEDYKCMRSLVMTRMGEYYPEGGASRTSSSSSSSSSSTSTVESKTPLSDTADTKTTTAPATATATAASTSSTASPPSGAASSGAATPTPTTAPVTGTSSSAGAADASAAATATSAMTPPTPTPAPATATATATPLTATGSVTPAPSSYVPSSLATGKVLRIPKLTHSATDDPAFLRIRLTEEINRATAAELQVARLERELALLKAQNSNGRCILQ